MKPQKIHPIDHFNEILSSELSRPVYKKYPLLRVLKNNNYSQDEIAYHLENKVK